MRYSSIINGWDIGGVNIKAVQIDSGTMPAAVLKSINIPFEIWQDPDKLAAQLDTAANFLCVKNDQAHAITITAELSDAFRTKREGILFIVHALKKAFGDSQVFVFNLKGGFYGIHEAEKDPLLCAASNWLASSSYIGKFHSDCILIDVGSTTTDIIPIVNGSAVCEERTDTGRLLNSELVYSGVLRANPNTITHTVPLSGKECPVAAEYFAVMADIYLILGDISPESYTCPTPDGRDKTIDDARSRLARIICADSETLSVKEIDNIALYLKEKQIDRISSAVSDVKLLYGGADIKAVITGTGTFLAEQAAKKAGIHNIIPWKSEEDRNCLPAFAAASLLKEHQWNL